MSELWASLSHRCILKFLGVCVVGPSLRPFMMSSYMERGTFSEYIKANPSGNKKQIVCFTIMSDLMGLFIVA